MHTEVHGDATHYQPLYALVVYGSGKNGKGGFLTTHQIEQSNGGPVMGPGVLASKDALKSLVKKLNPRTKNRPELLHPRTLAKGDGYHLWWLPPGHRMVWFNAEEIGKRNGVTPHPGLVFMVSDDGWQVFAVKGRDRPTADARGAGRRSRPRRHARRRRGGRGSALGRDHAPRIPVDPLTRPFVGRACLRT